MPYPPLCRSYTRSGRCSPNPQKPRSSPAFDAASAGVRAQPSCAGVVADNFCRRGLESVFPSATGSPRLTLNHGRVQGGKKQQGQGRGNDKPPMMAIAIGRRTRCGERKSSRVSQRRREYNGAKAPHRGIDDRAPAANGRRRYPCSIWIDQNDGVAHDHAGQRNGAQHRHKSETVG